MNKLSLIIIASLAVVSFAVAQGAGPKGVKPGTGVQSGKPGQGGGMRGMRQMNPKIFEEIATKLKLTAAQKQQWQAANKEMGDRMMAMRPKAAAGAPRTKPTAEQKKKFEAVRDAYQAKVAKILTPAQQTQLKAIQKEMRDKRMKEGGGRPGGPPPTGGPSAGKTGKPGKGGGGN